ncbi:alginate lyase family protein [uncultured Thiodictyon sp.]|uniref:heparinase II/III family protein n=1 Tax=uncultured Thiodictyon sp. TaxID=1846217 RepID=UPI0026000EA7|nr:alginate lyase family protein [uncultured Thiodictyon sp.]
MLLRYWHTLRHLRPVQLYGRFWFRLYRPRLDERLAPPLRRLEPHWATPVARPVSLLGPETLRLLNEEHRVAGSADWNHPRRDQLWLYNLSYFDDLNAVEAPTRANWQRALLRRWVAENPPGIGTGWEPYPTSLRIVNWVKWALAGNALPPDCLHSLAVQARWLRRRMEYHLLGNHLLANAKALVFAGSFFHGDEADAWRAQGRGILSAQLCEQVLPDGGHCERSPMYHAILLEDVLDLVNLATAYPATIDPGSLGFYRDQAQLMAQWLQALCHPDGEIAFFNDAALGIAPTLVQLIDYGRRLGLRPAESAADGLVWLRESGYLRLTRGPAVALLDVAPIGPDYLPGHAHADTLSFELSLFGRRVIVNGGTSRYGSGPERLAERGTAAHSTVQIDGADSSEVWGGFRVARRARPLDVRVDPVPHLDLVALRGSLGRPGARPPATPSPDGPLLASAAHDGYRRLPGRPLHRRTWELTPGRLTVTDRIEGVFSEATARFHLHPEVVAEGTSERGRLHLPGGRIVRWQVSGGQARIVADQWHPQFGLSLPAQCLEVVLTGDGCRLELDWVIWT